MKSIFIAFSQTQVNLRLLAQSHRACHLDDGREVLKLIQLKALSKAGLCGMKSYWETVSSNQKESFGKVLEFPLLLLLRWTKHSPEVPYLNMNILP